MTLAASLLLLSGRLGRGIGLRAGADVLGAVLATSGVMLGVFAIADRAQWWAGLIAAALLAAFAARQRALQAAGHAPLLPPRVLASRTVSGANLSQLLVIGAAMGFQVIVVLYMQRGLARPFGPAHRPLRRAAAPVRRACAHHRGAGGALPDPGPRGIRDVAAAGPDRVRRRSGADPARGHHPRHGGRD